MSGRLGMLCSSPTAAASGSALQGKPSAPPHSTAPLFLWLASLSTHTLTALAVINAGVSAEGVVLVHV